VDIYEGMPHVHQFLYKTPESKIALSPKKIEFKQAKDELNEFITELRSHFIEEEQIVFPLALRANLP
jgi:iron-sulfur cluster repair protein YtfE (RIC family)